ncbi:MAG: ribonuclease III [Chlorobi bacterium]|nr:ribonuclease III [Chlorobiota bacterium]
MNKSIFHRFWSRFKSKPESASGEEEAFRQRLKKILGFEPGDIRWYEKAFTHPSFNLRDRKGNSYNFERLEFLGDSVLSLIIADYLFRKYPERNEGELTEIRAKLVSRRHLNEIGRKWRLRDFLPKRHRGQYGRDVEGNLVEALTGAVYMDQGFERARQFVLDRVIRSAVNMRKIQRQISSYKGYMIGWAQKRHKRFAFRTRPETTREGREIFHSEFLIDGKTVGHGRNISKKKAEESAARNAYRRLVGK